MKQVKVLIVMTGIFLSGCAFKESTTQKQQQALRTMDGRLLSSSITWDGQSQPIQISEARYQRGTGGWTNDQVITLPAAAPETMIVTAQLARDPQDVKEWTPVASATTGDDINERILGAQILESTPANLGTSLKVQLTGVNTLFRPDREQRMYLTLKLQNGSEVAASFRWIISTPPSRVTVLKNDTILGHQLNDVSTELLRLSSQAETRTLVRRIELRNDSFETMRLTIPFRTHGTVRLRGTHYSLDSRAAPHTMLYSQKSEKKTWDQEADFYIFPLREDLPKTWTGYAQADLNTLILRPGEKLELGLYLPGEVMAQLQAHPSSTPVQKSLPSSTAAHCAPGSVTNLPDPGWCDLFDGGHGPWHFPPDTIALMKQAIGQMRACVDSGWGVDPCNQAAVIDEALDQRKMPHPANGIPWMIYYGCQKNSTCPGDPSHVCESHHGWSWTISNSSFQDGIKTDPVTVDWKENEVPIQVRFSPGTEQSQSEARSLTLFPAVIVIREL